MKKDFKITSDGSHTLYIKELDETYHSKHGAIQEAEHVFVKAGLDCFDQSEMSVLEIGFGTGLNAFLTLLYAHKNNNVINYTGLEAFPLDVELTSQLNYTTQLNSSNDEKTLFNKLHSCSWDEKHVIDAHFSLTKIHHKMDAYFPIKEFNIIFFDAFGPNIQPDMWTKEVFVKMYESLVEGGVLVTYCAKGSVKRTLKEVGFELESLPGPPGKREMSRAIKRSV